MSKTLIAPVSGGAFPSQIGIIYNLAGIGYKPDLSLGSSGGNVAAYLAAGADWNQSGIIRLAREINSKLFIKSWWNPPLTFLPSWLIGFFKGSMYNCSDGPKHFFKDNFNTVTATRYEIWTGTTNLDQSKAQIFCNRKQKDSLLEVKVNTKLMASLEPAYLDGDVDAIVQACQASACIPTMVDPQIINKERYVDGGLMYASPLTVMKDSIDRKDLHMTYLSSYNMDSLKEHVTEAYGNMLTVNRTTFTEIVKSLCVQDRYNAINMIPDAYSLEGPGTVDVMSYIEKNRGKAQKSLVEYYPLSDEVVELTKFTSDDVLHIADTATKKFGYRLWWSGDRNIFRNIPKS